ISSDAVKDLIGGLVPHKRPRLLVPRVDPGLDRRGQLRHRPVAATLEPLGRQLRKPALHQVQPGTVGGGEVQVETGVGELSQITCTSSPAGTAWSTRPRNRLNSIARCRGVSWEITRPEARFSAAYRLVVPWRR